MNDRVDPTSPEFHHDFLAAVDSDGCVFASMEIKHRECFAPNFVEHFGLGSFVAEACEVWAYSNLYSLDRGRNRFVSLLNCLDLLRERICGGSVPRLEHFRQWLERESRPSLSSLEHALESADEVAREELARVRDWCRAVNAEIARATGRMKPFPNVSGTLETISTSADIVVVSATPYEALEREWQKYSLARHARAIAGQEMGKKPDLLARFAFPRYRPDRVLMIGDAPGDLEAAQANGIAFYPIRPGREDECWMRLRDEAWPRFRAGTYRGDYEEHLVGEFLADLG